MRERESIYKWPLEWWLRHMSLAAIETTMYFEKDNYKNAKVWNACLIIQSYFRSTIYFTNNLSRLSFPSIGAYLPGSTFSK